MISHNDGDSVSATDNSYRQDFDLGEVMSILARRPFTTGLAAAIAGIVTLSLVAPPPNVDVAFSRVEVPAVQLAAATTAEISTTAVNTFVRLASAVSPADGVPTSGTHPAAPSQGATTAAALPPGVTNALSWIGGVAVGALIAPIWYLAFPLSLPISYEIARIGQVFCFPALHCPPSPPPTVQEILKNTLEIFLLFPFVLPAIIINTLITSPTAASTDTPAGPAVTKFARLVTTTFNTVKAQIGAAAPIQRTVAPKPLSFAVKSGPLAGNPRVSRNEPTARSGALRTAVKSMTGNLSNTVKHATGITSKNAQN
jgi:hypothetical protein